MNEKVKRAYSLEQIQTNETEEKGTIEGYAAVFNQRTKIGSYFEEEIDPKAFDNCVFDDCALLANHDTSRLAFARARRNTKNSTLEIKVDSIGLKVRTDLAIKDNTDHKNLYSSVKRGDINGMSFMFDVNKSEWSNMDTDMPLRRITGISRVYEVSVVNFPAYEGTEVYARSSDTLENEKKVLENARSAMLVNKDLELAKAKALFKIKNRIGG